jgi:peptidoglycan/LPS O-acetylase OafA/YrhL
MMERPRFEPRLESLRGIAALTVAAHHGMTTFAVLPGDRPPILATVHDWLLGRVTNPGMAVLFFFVLSGYVLGQSLNRDPDYARFIVRRAFRILPAFIVSVLFAYACVTLIRIDVPPADLTDFFKRPFWPMPTVDQLKDNLVFRSSWINGPTWSIYWEIIGSIFLPPLVYLHCRVPEKYQILIFIAASAVISFLHIRITNYVLLPIVEYFYAGFFLPPLIARWLPGRWWSRAIAFGFGYWIILYVGPTNAGEFATIGPASIGASLMIGAVLTSQEFLNWLRLRPLRFLGRVSYSFYLIHWPVFYLTAITAVSIDVTPHGASGNWIVCITSIAFALALSALMYRWLEVPSIEAGRRLTNLKIIPYIRHELSCRLANYQSRKNPPPSARPLEANDD